MAGMPVVQLPSPGVVAGRPRKEGIYDTEVEATGSATGTSLTLFSNFSAFTTAPVTVTATKQYGRDVNLRGTTSGLPKSTHLFWYEWRCKIRPLGTNLASAANNANGTSVTEEILRYRQTSSIQFEFSQTVLIQAQLDELPDGVGPAWGSTTHTASILLGPNCVPERKGKIVTISGKPVSIDEQQEFSVTLKQPQLTFNPTADLFITIFLEGMLLRAITG